MINGKVCRWSVCPNLRMRSNHCNCRFYQCLWVGNENCFCADWYGSFHEIQQYNDAMGPRRISVLTRHVARYIVWLPILTFSPRQLPRMRLETLRGFSCQALESSIPNRSSISRSRSMICRNSATSANSVL